MYTALPAHFHLCLPQSHFAITSTYRLAFPFFPLVVPPALGPGGPPSKSSILVAALSPAPPPMPVGGLLGGALPGNGTPGGPPTADIPLPGRLGGPDPVNPGAGLPALGVGGNGAGGAFIIPNGGG
jgi:hypothetical protein